MSYLNENLARSQAFERIGDAHAQRRGRQLVLARRCSRRAERAALQARLVLARTI